MIGFHPGKMADLEAEVQFADPSCPWNDPASSFYGGQLLLPPYRTTTEHTWLAWSRVHPDRVIGQGTSPRGPFMAVKRTSSVDGLSSEQLIVDVLRGVASLHTQGVTHNAIDPSCLAMWNGRAHLVGLQHCTIDGVCGISRPLSPSFDAPENLRGLGSHSGDLFSTAKTLIAVLADGALPAGWIDVLSAMASPEVSDRPASILDVLRAVGEHVPEDDEVLENDLAPARTQWSQGDWVWEPLVRGRPYHIVERVDEQAQMGLGLWTLRAAAGRVLQAAHQVGGRLWSVLGILCRILAERSAGLESDMHARQAIECDERADMSDRHPTGNPVMDLCREHRYASAMAEAASDAAARATVSWFAGDLPAVRSSLVAATAQVTASWNVSAALRVVIDPDLATGEDGFPEATIDAARQLASSGRFDLCDALANRCVPPLSSQIRLLSRVANRNLSGAYPFAVDLAERGIWNAGVIGVLALAGPSGDPLCEKARKMLPSMHPVLRDGELRDAAAAIARAPSSAAAWERFAIGQMLYAPDSVVALVQNLPAAAQVAFLHESVRAGLPSQAQQIAHLILGHDSSASIGMAEVAAVGLLCGDSELVRRAEARVIDHGAPDAMETWLTMGLGRASRAEHVAAEGSLRTAGALGLNPQLLARLEAHLIPLGLWRR